MARRRSGKKIDFVHWTGFDNVSLGLTAGSAALTLLAAQHDPETLLRIRGEYMTWVDSTQAPGALALISAGIILVPEGTSTTVLWSPRTDADAPWIWYDTSWIGEDELVTDVLDVPVLTGARKVIDNKAMRIVRNQELQFVVENATFGNAVTMNAAIAGRTLSGT